MQLGLELALMGMGTVFVFLITLIFLTTLMSTIISAYEKKRVQPVTATPAVAEGKNKASDEILKTVIAMAIKQHRSNRKEV